MSAPARVGPGSRRRRTSSAWPTTTNSIVGWIQAPSASVTPHAAHVVLRSLASARSRSKLDTMVKNSSAM